MNIKDQNICIVLLKHLYLMQGRDKQADIKLKQKIQQILAKQEQQQEKTLNLSYCVEQWEDILGFQDWSGYEKLILDGCKITNQKIGQVIKYRWPKIKTLSLSKNNSITGEGMKILMSHDWPMLQYFYIGSYGPLNSNTDDEALFHVVKKFDSIGGKIDFIKCSINWKGLVPLLTLKQIKLVSLCLDINNIGNKGAAILGKIYCPSLQRLSLINCKIGNQGVKRMLKNSSFNFKQLQLKQNPVSLDSIANFQLCRDWTKQNFLIISNSGEISYFWIFLAGFKTNYILLDWSDSNIRRTINYILVSKLNN